LNDAPQHGPPPDRQQIRSHAREAWHEMWTSGPFGGVLLLVFASFVFLEAAPDKEWAQVLSVLLQGATLLAALRAAAVATRYQHAARILVGLAVVSTIVAVSGTAEHLSLGFVRLLSVLLVAIAPVAIAASVGRMILVERRVTLQAIFGVVSIYLLLGMLFAFCYAAIAAIGQGSFFAGGQIESIQNFVYFSFVTLTTVGYGDLTAAHQVARTFAIVEALLGQLYLITVLSVFVSNLRPRSAVER
jgi:hypothetical protein